MDFNILLIIFLVTIVCELIDSGFGMMYGTILSPFLIMIGVEPAQAIPSILLSQALGGAIATVRHAGFKNIDVNINSNEIKIVSLIFGMGIVAVLAGVFLAVKIPKQYLTMYIGILVTIMGALVLLNKQFDFSWKRVYFIGFLSSFNKALSGGGFGPLVSTGLIVSGNPAKNSVAITDMAEVPICIGAFITWAVMSSYQLNYYFVALLCVGSMIGAYIGPYILSKIPSNLLAKRIIGGLALVLGIACIFGAKI